MYMCYGFFGMMTKKLDVTELTMTKIVIFFLTILLGLECLT